MADHAKKVANVKVVHLEPESARLAKARIARLPAAVHAIHEKGKFLLAARLKQFFDRADDSLFELADKATTNAEQNIYFDSMREVRVQRRGIERRFAIEIDAAFANLATGAMPETPEVDEAFTADALSLVQNDDLEQMVAIESSVSRANSEYAEQVQQLSLRLDTLVSVKVFEKNNPLGPSVLANGFMAQAKRLDIDLKAKLVLFKLFDKTVMHNLGGVYEAVNQILIDHNILPSLTTAARRQASAPAPAQTTPGGDATPELTQALQGLLNPAGARPATEPQLNELVSMLSMVQQAPAVSERAQTGISSLQLIEELYKNKGGQASISSTEREVMNLVDMLFKFILADRNLSQPMKELLALMQIPVIKVSLLDKSFFAKGGHSARKLLNDMATAALGWQGTDGRRDALYTKMQSIVDQLLTSFDSDVSIFNDLHADFSSFVEKERRRAEVIEKRTLDAEDGKARAEVARTVVSIEIELRTVDERLPQVVAELINGPWNNVMFVTYLKYGHKAREWQSVLSTLDDLVWSTKIPRTNDSRKQLIRLIPELLKRLRSGLDSISFNPFQMSELFKKLEDVHLNAIRGKAEADAPTPRTAIDKRSAPKVSSASNDNEVLAPIPETAKRQSAPPPTVKAEVTPGEIPAAPAVNPQSVAGTQSKPVAKASSATDAEQVRQSPPPTAADNADLQQVETFGQGGWFEMVDEKGESTRCRLAAIIKPTGKYIFVNRSGMKVAEHTKYELAELLGAKRLRALDNTMLFDRALETVVSSLRKPQP
ncbi:DUF1631 domain-containing protein [Teredinibacter turnerae]|uniref:DUF1631 domain-containing protein n=1 Tax=Teredinibacter turnerae TaxID=2426 RepID=UPI00037B8199|nr:DUF1631 domain-containing protein [Teredinibacter turnerae]